MIAAGIVGVTVALALCGVMLRDVARSRTELTYIEELLLTAERRRRLQGSPAVLDAWVEAIRIAYIEPMSEAFKEVAAVVADAWEPFTAKINETFDELKRLGLMPDESR